MYKTRHTENVDRQIFESIAANPGLGAGGIAKRTGFIYETVLNSLQRLLDDGKIVYRDRGHYLA